MESKNKEILSFLGRWILNNIFILTLALYLAVCIIFGLRINLPILALFAMVGILINIVYKEWNRRGLGFEKIEYGQDESLWGLIKSMPYWEKFHWVPVFGFLGLTLWATIQGLDLLFVGPKNPFLWFFTSFVIIVLTFLLIMISRGKNVVAYSIFYVLFDLATAFSFNFIHFYDNISATQNMDRDVRACEMYIKHQKPTLSRINESVSGDTLVLFSRIGGINVDIQSEYNRADNEDRIANNLNKEENYKASNSHRLNANYCRARARKMEKSIENERYQLISLRSVCVSAGNMIETQTQIEKLCAKYRVDKENFTEDDLTSLKNKVVAIDEQVSHFNRDSICIAKNYVFDNANDTIEWALSRLKKTRDDRFASINKLIDAVLKPAKMAQQVDDASQNPFIADDRQFDNRLIYLSVCLSATIDVLPLLLSIFVVYSKKRRKTS